MYKKKHINEYNSVKLFYYKIRTRLTGCISVQCRQDVRIAFDLRIEHSITDKDADD